MPRLLIIGAGGHGRSLAEAVTASGIHDLIGLMTALCLIIKF
jgi:prephenate dehydrogenase